MDAYDATAWTDLYVAAAGASAALAGLVFVAVSINIERILALPGVPNRALQTLLQLILLLRQRLVLLQLLLLNNLFLQKKIFRMKKIKFLQMLLKHYMGQNLLICHFLCIPIPILNFRNICQM